MGFFQNIRDGLERAAVRYTGDIAFLHGAASAAANVTAADGSIDESEVNAAIQGMMANGILSSSYTPSQIEEEVNNALQRAKSRAGRIQNSRYIEALSTRPVELRQDIFLIAADVADDGGIGEDEHKVLDAIAKSLNVNKASLLS